MESKMIFLVVFSLCLSGLLVIEARPNDDKEISSAVLELQIVSVAERSDLLHHDILGIYDGNVGLLKIEHNSTKPAEMETLIRDAYDKFRDEFVKISARELRDYYGSAVLREECRQAPPMPLTEEKLKVIQLICEENNKTTNPNVEENIDVQMSKVVIRELQKRFTIADIKNGCTRVEQLKYAHMSALEKAWIRRVCLEINK